MQQQPTRSSIEGVKSKRVVHQKKKLFKGTTARTKYWYQVVWWLVVGGWWLVETMLLFMQHKMHGGLITAEEAVAIWAEGGKKL